jgi:arylsulfatase A-like enzyme
MRDNLLMVPLVIRDPTREFSGMRITTQVRTIDILPTVAELMGVEVAAPGNGHSLVPILTGAEFEHRTAMSGETNRGFARIGIRDGRHKYIRAVDPKGLDADARLGLTVPARQLYDLVDDPKEDRNLIEEQPRLARLLDRRLAEWFNGLRRAPLDAKDPAADEKLLDRLRELGYVD